MRRLSHILIAAILLCVTACQNIPTNGVQHAHYAATEHVFLERVLPPPPAMGSATDQDDLNTVLQAQKTRQPKEIAGARADVALSIYRFADVLGPRFNAQNLPITNTFFDKVMQDEYKLIQKAKQHYNRPRPFVASRVVKPIVEQLPNAAYPSGHTSFAYTAAILLAQALPNCATQIFARANIYAYHRVVAGVHYPTDVQAGIIAASVMVNQWMNDPAFVRDYRAATDELRRVSVNCKVF